MRFSLKAILILVFFLVLGCQAHLDKPPSTSRGDVKLGSSLAEVMSVLGVPHEVSTYGNVENWYYNLGADKRIFVGFLNGEVVEVRE